jgi:hypothetical protein
MIENWKREYMDGWVNNIKDRVNWKYLNVKTIKNWFKI